MIYYRLALQNRRTDRWNWKSSALTSLQSVFHLLRIYNAIPQDRLRVFSASAKAELDKQLDEENNGRASGSVPAAQFMHRDSGQNSQANQREDSYIERTEQTPPRSIAVVSTASRQSFIPIGYAAETLVLNKLDQKRLEIEMGAGGDHDTPYVFRLPTFMPQLLAWMRLQDRAHQQG